MEKTLARGIEVKAKIIGKKILDDGRLYFYCGGDCSLGYVEFSIILKNRKQITQLKNLPKNTHLDILGNLVSYRHKSGEERMHFYEESVEPAKGTGLILRKSWFHKNLYLEVDAFELDLKELV